MRTLIVIQNLSDWKQEQPSEQMISFADYLDGNYRPGAGRSLVINLCRDFGYLSEGYYCSLLAEARGDRVIPSVQTLSELGNRSLYRIHLEDIDRALPASPEAPAGSGTERRLLSFFGRAADSGFDRLARALFNAMPCPILEISLRYRSQWEITGLKPLSPRGLEPEQQRRFAEALDRFSHRVWRGPRKKKAARYDLAILCDPGEALPPSDTRALKCFIRAGRELGVACDLITERDYLKLAEYDGLFIRTTTNIDHYSYRFAKKAESEGLAVIDDSTSILRCTNKIYLADMFRKAGVPAPRTVILHREKGRQLPDLGSLLGFPLVIKIPDGAFSLGVEKAADPAQVEDICTRLFSKSTLLLAQEFIYTEFDWRIGILDNEPLYACRYYMVKHHWQIYRHGGRTRSGAFDTLPIAEVSQNVIDTALRATRPIGSGFYGVDLKERDGRGVVIEVNDNPNIDRGIEDRHLGMELYRRILRTFLQRMQARRNL